MSRPGFVAASLIGVVLFLSGPLSAAADGDCGSAASAPGLPGASNEGEPRSCDNGPMQQEPAAETPMPTYDPPGGGEYSQPSTPAEMPDEIPEPPPQQ